MFYTSQNWVVQSSLLLNRRQGEKESANDYAQKLKSNVHVFYKATMQSTTDLENISKSTPYKQFAAGLLSDIKLKWLILRGGLIPC